MAKVNVPHRDPRLTPRGTDLYLIPSDDLVAKFSAFVITSRNKPGGEMNLTFGVPFDQIPNALAVMQYVGGVTFEITVRRVPMDELPEGGW